MFLYVICHSHTQYENDRKKNASLLSDVHDCKAWEMRRRQVGADSDDLCIQLLFCMDAIPAFKNQGMSLMPAESIILNFPPQLRSKVDFMMLHFLIPSTLKEWQQKKYFDYMVNTELNPLATTGIPYAGGRARVLIFATPFDLPGRDKFFYLRGRSLLTSSLLFFTADSRLSHIISYYLTIPLFIYLSQDLIRFTGVRLA